MPANRRRGAAQSVGVDGSDNGGIARHGLIHCVDGGDDSRRSAHGIEGFPREPRLVGLGPQQWVRDSAQGAGLPGHGPFLAAELGTPRFLRYGPERSRAHSPRLGALPKLVARSVERQGHGEVGRAPLRALRRRQAALCLRWAAIYGKLCVPKGSIKCRCKGASANG